MKSQHEILLCTLIIASHVMLQYSLSGCMHVCVMVNFMVVVVYIVMVSLVIIRVRGSVSGGEREKWRCDFVC